MTMSYSESTNVLKWTVRAYIEQASFPRDRAKMIGTKGLFTSLGLLSRHENDFIGDGARDVFGTLACKYPRYSVLLLENTVPHIGSVAEVADAKRQPVESIIRCVSIDEDEQDAMKDAPPLRSYSPTSVQFFNFDSV